MSNKYLDCLPCLATIFYGLIIDNWIRSWGLMEYPTVQTTSILDAPQEVEILRTTQTRVRSETVVW